MEKDYKWMSPKEAFEYLMDTPDGHVAYNSTTEVPWFTKDGDKVGMYFPDDYDGGWWDSYTLEQFLEEFKDDEFEIIVL